ncbi:MAG: IS21 family transposase [Thermodesulfobacteriota bacterium]
MPLFVRSREELVHLLVTMHTDGLSIRGLAKQFKMSRNTVRRILKENRDQRDKGHDILAGKKKRMQKHSKLDVYAPLIKERIKKFPDITGQRLYEELRDAGYTGGISILRDRLQKLRPKPKRSPIVRFETEPGVQGQMDWSPYTINFTRTGKTNVLCFSYILGFSRRHYIDFTQRRDFYTLIRRHQDAFRYFGGVPKECLYDNEKTVVLRWEAGRPVFNPGFIAFITHYNCRPIACLPGRKETKGKVEAPFKYVEGNLLNARRFQDIDDLRGIARWWLANRSDIHIHDTTGRPPIELFMEQELRALQPLPLHPYDSSEVRLMVCRLDGFIEFETNFYSVPYEYVGDILSMKAVEHEIFIYSPELLLIAHHERLPAGAGRKWEKPEHRGSKKVRYGLEPVRETFIALGDAAEYFITGLKERHPHNAGFHARYILHLKERYHCDDINKAFKHAMKYHAFDSKAIERILAARAKLRTLESIRNERARAELQKRLPRIKQRPLEEYSTLFINEVKEDERGEEDISRDSNTDQKTSKDPETDQDA